MLINIYKNQSDDARVEGLSSMKQFMDMEEALIEENEGLIDQVGLLDIEENDTKFIFLGLGNMSKFFFFSLGSVFFLVQFPFSFFLPDLGAIFGVAME
jgi:hypothetical protein